MIETAHAGRHAADRAGQPLDGATVGRRRRVARWRRAGLLGAAGVGAGLAMVASLPVTAVAAVRPAPPTTSRQVTVTEADNGHTVALRRGGTLTVVLHSTYWTIAGSSNPRVLREQGKPVTTPAPPSAHCVPGQGCGTVTARFLAVADGRADVTASRTTCGEALMCPPNQRSWVVHVVVTG